jgi:sugar-phosphatase
MSFTIEAVIFDMDGLLVDSEGAWEHAEHAIFTRLGVPLTEERWPERTRGLRVKDVVAHWYERYPWSAPSTETVERELVESVRALLASDPRPLEGAVEAVLLARERCRKVGLASSSPVVLIESTLVALGIRANFDVLHSAETEALGKPHPAVYLSAARALGVSPTKTLALEDSVAGVTAAKAAGMICVAVPAPAERSDPRFAIADVRLDSLSSLRGAWDELESRATRSGARRE